MKPNPEQDATIGSDNTQTAYALLEERKQMQDAFEQVCEAGDRVMKNAKRGTREEANNYYEALYALDRALERAAPFRKTGV